MCFNLMTDPKLFQEHFLPSFESLIGDKVANVRIALAECLAYQYKQKTKTVNEDFFKQLEQKLRQDSCNDVKKIFTDLDEQVNAEKLQHEKSQKLKKYVKKDSSESPTRRLQPKAESVNSEEANNSLLISSNALSEKKDPEVSPEKKSAPQVIQLEKADETTLEQPREEQSAPEKQESP